MICGQLVVVFLRVNKTNRERECIHILLLICWDENMKKIVDGVLYSTSKWQGDEEARKADPWSIKTVTFYVRN
jgi:hypothetical protein